MVVAEAVTAVATAEADPIKEQYYQMNYFLSSYYLFKFKFYAKVLRNMYLYIYLKYYLNIHELLLNPLAFLEIY